LIEEWLPEKYKNLRVLKTRKYITFGTALDLFLQTNGLIIVETGTIREEDDPTGCSTILFGAFCKKYSKRLYTVDNDMPHIEFSCKVTKEFESNISYILMDSLEFLNQFTRPIDLLYLDSFDCPLPPEDATQAQEHQLKEIKAAYKNFHKGSLVLLDDNNWANGGKTRLAKKYLLETGEWRCIINDEQSLWEKTK